MKTTWVLLSAVTCLSLVTPSLTVLAQEVMSSSNFGIQSDSVNFAGARSTSASYGLEDTLGEIATGKVESSNFGADVGYQAMLVLVAGDTIAPTAPASLAATALTSTSIELNWSASTDNVAVTRYYIYRDGNRIADVGVFPRSFTDTGLESNTTYTYYVTASDDATNESSASPTATATTFPTPSSAGSGVSAIMYDLSIVTTENKALVTFKTTADFTAAIAWGTNANYSLGNKSETVAGLTHSFLIENLLSATDYLLRISLKRADGYLTNFGGVQFRTLSQAHVVVPANAINFTATAQESGINLAWSMPQDPSITGVIIVRSDKFYPNSPSDGTVLFEGVGTSYADAHAEIGVKYYYAIFTRDLAGNYSSGGVATATVVKPGGAPVVEVPFEDVKLVGSVDAAIEGLTLKDFLFIQDGDSLPVKNDSVTIDGGKNLAVALRAYKVPPVLKTIAVTLATNDDKSFTFILRANKDNTRYEAVVAPMGAAAIYGLKITVTDFKNQGLKKLSGTMKVLKQAEFVLDDSRKKFFAWLLLLVLLALLILAWERRKDKKEPISITPPLTA